MLSQIKYALRRLLHSPGFTITALITLALGIGINTTAFTVLNRLMLQSLPFRDPSTLVQVGSTDSQGGINGTAPADYFDEREQNDVFSDLAAYQPYQTMSYAEAGNAPIQVGAIYMTANFFPILGVAPELGRTPSEEESRKSAFVCLISDWFWRQHYNADPGVLGRSVRVNSRVSTIIGVMPPALDDPALFSGHPGFFYLDPVTHSRTFRRVGWYTVMGRLKPGVTVAQAQAGMNVVASRLAQQYPDTNKDRGFRVVRYPTNQLGNEGAQLTWMTLALSGLVLVIACINLANLQIVRATGRGHEIAVRMALGCSPWRLVGMILLESVLVSLAGGALGLLTALWSNVFVARFFAMDMPLNLRVLAFTFLVSFLTALFFGSFPAWLTTRTDVSGNLKASGRGSTSGRSRKWLRQALILIELAMAVTLLAGSGFFIGGIYRLTHRELGWDTGHEIIGIVRLDQDHFGGDANRPKVLEFSRNAVAALRALPGVEEAALANESPSWGNEGAAYAVWGRPAPEKGKEPIAGYMAVSPGWFRVFGMHLLEGREFTEADRDGSAPVVIVDESLARKLWPGESAIGKRLAGGWEEKPPLAEVVGVMRDFRGGGEFYNPTLNGERFLRPWAQYSGNGTVVFSVRTSGPPGPLKESVRKALGVLLPDLALNYLATIDEDTAATYSYFSFLRRILVQIAVLGLFLSAIGTYGIVANLAAERTKEIGIRMALGAQASGILWLFIRNALALALAGAALGLIGAFFLNTTLGRILPVLPGRDPWVVMAAAALLVGVALVASWVPARRTTKVNPVIALRTE